MQNCSEKPWARVPRPPLACVGCIWPAGGPYGERERRLSHQDPTPADKTTRGALFGIEHCCIMTKPTATYPCCGSPIRACMGEDKICPWEVLPRAFNPHCAALCFMDNIVIIWSQPFGRGQSSNVVGVCILFIFTAIESTPFS